MITLITFECSNWWLRNPQQPSNRNILGSLYENGELGAVEVWPMLLAQSTLLHSLRGSEHAESDQIKMLSDKGWNS
jgi:hypothetical protein